MHLKQPEPIRDRTGAIIGSIEYMPNGDQVLRNKDGEIRGYYDHEADSTRDDNKNIVAKGNKLRTMIC